MIETTDLLQRLESPTEKLVEAYFRRVDDRFAGELFNAFGSNPPFSLTPDDLLAVGFLDEAFDAEAASRILVGDRGAYEEWLHEMPPALDLWEATDAQIGHDSPAWIMWARLVDIPRVGPVRAGKLMARKRPRLIPIWDFVVAAAIHTAEGGYWSGLREILTDDALRARLNALRPAGISSLVSTLRLLDVAIWMWESQSQAARVARKKLEDHPG